MSIRIINLSIYVIYKYNKHIQPFFSQNPNSTHYVIRERANLTSHICVCLISMLIYWEWIRKSDNFSFLCSYVLSKISRM